MYRLCTGTLCRAHVPVRYVQVMYRYVMYRLCTGTLCTGHVPVRYVQVMYRYVIYRLCTGTLCTAHVPVRYVQVMYRYVMYRSCTGTLCTGHVPVRYVRVMYRYIRTVLVVKCVTIARVFIAYAELWRKSMIFIVVSSSAIVHNTVQYRYCILFIAPSSLED